MLGSGMFYEVLELCMCLVHESLMDCLVYEVFDFLIVITRFVIFGSNHLVPYHCIQ